MENQDQESTQENSLYWKFDVSTFRLLGRELITDRITALFELVKNCYDANATRVDIIFQEVNPLNSNSKIIIQDNGIGMSIDDIKNKWMIIGTSSKRTARVSPEPFYRKVAGKKGVGRFAVDKLGSNLIMKTKKKTSEEIIFVELDWSEYEGESVKNETSGTNTYFTEIANKYRTSIAKNKELHGCVLEISQIRDVWTQRDIHKVSKELSKLISPFQSDTIKNQFEIFITSPYAKLQKVTSNTILNATEEIHLLFDEKSRLQQSLRFENGLLNIIEMSERSFGLIKFDIYYFDQDAKNRYKRLYNREEKIDGIKIYRDGLITTPFAEYEENNIYKRDVLGIDKRRYSGFFDKVSSSDILGFIEITDQGNPYIKDSTNRQDFEDNTYYKDLKRFITQQLVELEAYLKFKREKDRAVSITNLSTVKAELNSFVNLVNQIQKTAPVEIKQQLAELGKQTNVVKQQVNIGIKAYQVLEKEKIRQENLFMSLMSLQDYAFEIAHVINTLLSLITSDAEFVKSNSDQFEVDDLDLYRQFEISSSRIHSEMVKLSDVVNFLLSYAKSNIQFSKIDIRQTIDDLFNIFYLNQLESKGIKTEIIFEQNLEIIHNEQFFRDIFQNLISNSIKAVEDNTGDKFIKCTARLEDDKFIIHFSDNGYGISDEDKERIFDIFFTRTEEKGGAGIGLYIVKKRVEAMRGIVRVIENEFKPSGATIEIILPFVK